MNTTIALPQRKDITESDTKNIKKLTGIFIAYAQVAGYETIADISLFQAEAYSEVGEVLHIQYARNLFTAIREMHLKNADGNYETISLKSLLSTAVNYMTELYMSLDIDPKQESQKMSQRLVPIEVPGGDENNFELGTLFGNKINQ